MIAALHNQSEYLKILAAQDSVDWNIQNNVGWTTAMHAVDNFVVEDLSCFSEGATLFFAPSDLFMCLLQ